MARAERVIGGAVAVASTRVKSAIAIVWISAVAGVSLFSVSQASARDVVLLPSAPTNRVVVFFHGSGGRADNIVNNGGVSNESTIFLHRGFERFFIYGGSMGGLDAMQMIGRIHPEAAALVSPVCNIKGVPLIQAGVETAWGDARPDYLSPVSANPEPGLPVKIWASPEDTWVPKDLNADLCARELRRRGASVRMKPTTGEHTNAHMLRDNSVPNFFSAVSARAGTPR